MSDAAIIAIVSVIATVVVALAGHAKDYFARRQDIAAKERERREDAQEWYRRTLFEQRLSTTNQAYSYLLRINRPRAFAKGDEERQHELRDCVIEAHDPRGRPCYWIGNKRMASGTAAQDDAGAVAAGSISVTPIKTDFTNHAALARLSEALA